MIRPLRIADISQVVSVHLECFPGFFLSFLGPKFLNLYYSELCSYPEKIAFVYLNSTDQVIGFSVGAVNPKKFYSILLRKKWINFLYYSLNATLKKPSIIYRIAKAVLYPSQNPGGNEVAGIFSSGVIPKYRSTIGGSGGRLFKAFLNEAKTKGCKQVITITNRDKNESVNLFLQKLGFKIERQYTTSDGRRMNEYWIHFYKA